MKQRRKGEGRGENAVAEAIAKVGGVVQAAAICRVRQATLYGWRKQGFITLLGPALRLANASGIAVERFAVSDSERA